MNNINFYQKYGYLHLKGFYTPNYVHDIRKIIFDFHQSSHKTELGNRVGLPMEILSYPSLSELILNKKLINTAESVLKGPVSYFGNSTIVVGPGSKGFHRDCLSQNNLTSIEWQNKEYKLIHYNAYLQPSDNLSGGIKILPKSHYSKIYKIVHNLNSLAGSKSFESKIRKILIGFENLKWKYFSLGYIPSIAIGDSILWNFRTTHSGGAMRLKSFKNLTLPTFIENITPDSYFRPGNDQDRIQVSIVLGSESNELRRYMESRRQAASNVKCWKISKPWSQEIISKAQKVGLNLIKPSEEFGSEYQPCKFSQIK